MLEASRCVVADKEADKEHSSKVCPPTNENGTRGRERTEPPKRKVVTIEAPPKVYRPKPPSQYQEPELREDLLDLAWVQEHLGRSLKKENKELPPRDDIIIYDNATDKEEMERGFNLMGCPAELHSKVRQV
eukprot:4169021-Ditylum_brightwellii.AAC.1